MTAPLRVIWQSNAPWCPTGYGVQAHHILPRMRRHKAVDDVALFAFWGLQGGIWETKLGGQYFRVYPPMFEPWGNDVIDKHVDDFDANVIITLVDIWVLKKEYGNRTYWCPYMPVDTLTLPKSFVPLLRNTYMPITYSRHASELLNDAHIENVYIPHGVDTNTYRPRLEEQGKLKEWLGFSEDNFVVGMVAANKSWPSRKGFPEAFQAFRALHDKHPEARMYIHTVSTQGMGGPNLPEMAAHYGVAEYVRFTQDYYAFLGLDPEDMASVYNAFDVLLAPSMGEGFCIPLIEAQACGVPVIVTDATSMPELVGAGWKVPYDHTVWVPTGSWQVTPSVGHIIDALEEAYRSNPRVKFQKDARKLGMMYSWNRVWNQYWDPFLERLGSELTPRIRKRLGG